MVHRRAQAAVAAGAMLILLATGCAGATVEGAAEAAPASTSTETGLPTWTRVQPVAPSAPATYSLGRDPDNSTVVYANGTIPLGTGPVTIDLGYRVEDSGHGNSPLLAQNLKQWQQDGIAPEPFEADGARGFWSEDRITAAENPKASGTSRFYVVAKGAVTVTLSVWAPEGTELTDELRQTADQLARSVRFEESTPASAAAGQQVTAKVPFSFERPSSLPNPDQAEFGSTHWIRYEIDSQSIEVSLQKRETAAADYADKVRNLQGTEATVRDVTEQPSTATTIGTKVDEGVGTAPRHDGGVALMYFILRKGDLLIEVRSSGNDGPLPESVQEAVGSIMTTMDFG